MASHHPPAFAPASVLSACADTAAGSRESVEIGLVAAVASGSRGGNDHLARPRSRRPATRRARPSGSRLPTRRQATRPRSGPQARMRGGGGSLVVQRCEPTGMAWLCPLMLPANETRFMPDNAATRLLDQYLTPTKTWRTALTERSAALDAAEVTDDPDDVRRRAHARWYEEIVGGWILDPAKALASSSNRHEGMAAIALAIQFLEVHGAAVEGTETKGCEELVKQGYKEVSESGWPDPDDTYGRSRRRRRPNPESRSSRPSSTLGSERCTENVSRKPTRPSRRRSLKGQSPQQRSRARVKRKCTGPLPWMSTSPDGDAPGLWLKSSTAPPPAALVGSTTAPRRREAAAAHHRAGRAGPSPA